MVQGFKFLDPYDRGYFDLRDIQEFVHEYFQHITIQRAERILRRLDLDYDGKVIYSEWNQSTRPRSLNKTLLVEIDENEKWLQDQELRLRTQKIMSPEKFIKTKYDPDNIHESKVNISPSKQYVRTPVKRNDKIDDLEYETHQPSTSIYRNTQFSSSRGQ
jgi:hypothetical protein